MRSLISGFFTPQPRISGYILSNTSEKISVHNPSRYFCTNCRRLSPSEIFFNVTYSLPFFCSTPWLLPCITVTGSTRPSTVMLSPAGSLRGLCANFALSMADSISPDRLCMNFSITVRLTVGLAETYTVPSCLMRRFMFLTCFRCNSYSISCPFNTMRLRDSSLFMPSCLLLALRRRQPLPLRS